MDMHSYLIDAKQLRWLDTVLTVLIVIYWFLNLINRPLSAARHVDEAAQAGVLGDATVVQAILKDS